MPQLRRKALNKFVFHLIVFFLSLADPTLHLMKCEILLLDVKFILVLLLSYFNIEFSFNRTYFESTFDENRSDQLIIIFIRKLSMLICIKRKAGTNTRTLCLHILKTKQIINIKQVNMGEF